MEDKLRIYHLLSARAWLKPDNGDAMTELKLIKAMSSFSDVYYNDRKVDFSKHDYGMTKKTVSAPENAYSLYYVRNNIDIFRELPGPKVWLGVPYNEEAYGIADAVITYTSAWSDMLQNYNSGDCKHYFEGVYPDKIVEPKKVINFGQYADEDFRRAPNVKKQHLYRMKFGNTKTIGFFGRIDKQTVPAEFISHLPAIRSKVSELSVVFAGKIRAEFDSSYILNAGFISHSDMPDAIDACDLMIAGNAGFIHSEWLASGKTLDAIMRKTPILIRRSQARIEQLGADYPMFYSEGEEIQRKIIDFFCDHEFRSHVESYMKNLFSRYSIKRQREELKAKITSLVDGYQSSD